MHTDIRQRWKDWIHSGTPKSAMHARSRTSQKPNSRRPQPMDINDGTPDSHVKGICDIYGTIMQAKKTASETSYASWHIRFNSYSMPLSAHVVNWCVYFRAPWFEGSCCEEATLIVPCMWGQTNKIIENSWIRSQWKRSATFVGIPVNYK